MKQIKVQSEVDYKTGIVLFDDDTGEIFEVVSCVRISLFDKYKFGLTLKEVKDMEKVQ